MWFHHKDSIYFIRRVGGSVHVAAFRETPDDPEAFLRGGEPKPYFQHLIDPDSWASITASMSAGGELNNRFYAARDFHDSTGQVNVVSGGRQI